MKRFSFTFTFILYSNLIFSQIQIGTGTTAFALPMHLYYGYNLSQTIYLKSAINTSGLVSTISYYAITRSYADDVKIYMTETDKSEFSGSSDWIPLSGFTLVYDGKFPELSVPGWCNIELQNRFVFSNTKNLAVMFYEFKPGSNPNYSFWGSAQNKASIYYRSDSSNPDPASPPSGTVTGYIPTTKIGIADFPDNDIEIRKLDFSNPYPPAGEAVTISVTVRNIGKNVKGSVPVVISKDGSVLISSNVSLSSLEEKVVTYNWTATEGTHVFEAKSNLTDDNNANNTKTATLVSYLNTFPNNAKIAGRLTLANSPYTANGLVTVPQGYTLTIDPGVVIRMKTGSDYNYSDNVINVGGLYVKGKLIANGTSSQRITFTRLGTSGNWGCIAFHRGADPKSVFSYCSVEYANQLSSLESVSYSGAVSADNLNGLVFNQCRVISNNNYGFWFNYSSADVTNTVVANNKSYGILCQYGKCNLINNTITGNGEAGYYYYSNTSPVVANNIFWGNKSSILNGGYSSYGFPVVTYSLIQEDIMPSGVQGNSEGCIFKTNPQLGSDYSIPYNSPCVNTGKADTTGLKVGLADHLGQNRIAGGRIDMGACEYQGVDRIVVLTPNGREGWMGGSVRNILWRGSAANVKLEYTDNNGSSWNTIVGNMANTGTYAWTLPAIESQRCRVRVSDVAKATVADQSDTTFTVFTSVIPANTILTGRLTLANSPYTINGLVTIPKGDSLIIDPGVVLKFKTGTDYTFSSSADTINVGGLYIKGKLIAKGTSTQRITFTRLGTSGNWGCIAFHRGADPKSVFSFCHVEYANQLSSLESTDYAGAVSVSNLNGLVFTQCRIINNNLSGISLYYSDGNLYNTVVANNKSYGILSQYSKYNLINNTITGNGESGYYYYSTTSPVVANNIFWGNKSSILNNGYSYGFPVVTYCIIQEDAMPSKLDGNSEGCIFKTNPQLGSDYSIPYNSPCVNMGKADTTGLKVGLADHLGQNRIAGGRIDMGACEYQGVDRIVVLTPNGREGWMGGSVRHILWRGSAANVKLEYTENNGASWNTIVGNMTNTGTYAWTLPAIESQRCRVRVSDAANATVADASDTTFTVFTSVIPANTILTGRLTLANSPYTINGLVTIPKGDSLIIDPGVVLKFKTGTDYAFSSSADTINVGGLYVKGKLIAKGTSTQRITFTRLGTSGNWGCIAFHRGADPKSVFSFCSVEYANQLSSLESTDYAGAVSVSNLNGLVFNQCRVISNNNYGFSFYYSSADVTNTLVANNKFAGVSSQYNKCNLINNTITGNGGTGYYYYSNTSPVVTNNIFWGNQSSIRNEGYSYGFPIVTYCLIQEDALPTGIQGNSEGCIFKISPQLGSDYSIPFNSPCVNTGKADTTGLKVGLVDHLGQNRVTGGHIDMGACEYQGIDRIVLLTPNGREGWMGGSVRHILWRGSAANVKLEYTENNGASWNTIVGSMANTGTYAWTLPAIESQRCRVRVSDAANATVADASDTTFTVITSVIPANTILTGRLTLANSPYTINGLVTIPKGDSLIIEPGVVLQFKTGTDYTFSSSADTINVGGLYVKGKLIAKGTSTQRITFTRLGTSGNWGCIAFHAGADPKSVFSFCSVEYANQLSSLESTDYAGAVSVSNLNGLVFNQCRVISNNYYGFYLYYSESGIYNSVVANNKYIGIYAYYRKCSLINNTITGNAEYGFYSYYANVTPVLTNNIFWGNRSSLGTQGSSNQPLVTYCLIQEDALPTGIQGNSEGCIFKISPQLGSDYSIPFNSPCVNTGKADTTGLKVGLVDHLGQNRVAGGRIDMGACEYQGIDRIVVLTPNGREGWMGGSVRHILWRGNAANVKLEYTENNGALWNTIVGSMANTGTYAWTLPAIESQRCRVRVSDAANATVADASDTTFTVITSVIPANTILTGRLTLANSPYTINGLVTIPKGDSLIIDPGVVLKFKTGTDCTFSSATDTINVGGLYVKGKLISKGTSTLRITFTRLGTSGHWGCIAFHTGADPKSVFSFCNVEYANQLGSLESVTYYGAVSVDHLNGLVFNQCRVISNNYYGLYLYYSESGIYNCVVSNNKYIGIYSSNRKCSLINNTITGNAEYGFYSYYANVTPVLMNNIFWGNRYSLGTQGSSNQPLVTYCLIQEDALPTGIQGNSEGCIFNTLPQLGNDFSLLASSPLINKGTNITEYPLPTVDLFGKTRIFDGTVDIGASEFQSTKRLKITDPNGGDEMIAGSVFPVKWTGNVPSLKLEYSTDNGSSWSAIASGLPNTGTYSWTVPAIQSFSCHFRLSDATDPSIYDTSDSTFTIYKNDVESHLFSYWNFDNYSLNDLSETKNHGTKNGDAFFGNGIKLQSLLLDGTGDYMAARQIPSPEAYTLSLWFRTKDPGSLIGINTTSSGRERHLYVGNDGKLFFGVYAARKHTIQSSSPVNDGQWHFAVATFKSTGISLYLDGLKVASFDSTLTTTSTSDSWFLGYGSINGWPSEPASDYLKGDIDEVKFYDIALSEAQVQKLGVLLCPVVRFAYFPGNAISKSDSLLVVNRSANAITINGITSSNPYFSVALPPGTSIPAKTTRFLPATLSFTTAPDSSSLRMNYRIDSSDDFETGMMYLTTFTEDHSELALYARNAIKYYDSCFAAGPSSIATMNNLAVLYRLAGNTGRAYPVITHTLKRAQENKTGFTGILLNGGVVQSDRKNSANAFEWYTGAFNTVKSDSLNSVLSPQIYFNQAWEHFVNDSLAKARTKAWATIFHQKSNDYLVAKAYALLGVVEAKSKDTLAAIDNLLLAKRNDPSGPVGKLAEENLKTLGFGIPDPIYRDEYVSVCNGQNYLGWTVTGTYKRTFMAANKADSIVTTHLTVNPTYNITERKSICTGESYYGWSTSGTYQRKLQTTAGCDSVINVILTVNSTYEITEYKTICQGQNYLGWTTSGTYKRTLKTIMGCDSVINTVLTVNPSYHFTEYRSICQGQSYLGWNESGTYHRTFKTKAGCDSIYTTILTVHPVKSLTENISICQGQSYQGWTTSGTYKRTLQSKAGCDSVVTTVLTVTSVINTTENKSICEGQNYLGWTTSGTYKRTLQSKTGCDSIVTTVLSVNPIYNITENKSICQGQNYNGWTTSGTYQRKLQSKAGCDSTITTILTVSSSVSVTERISICTGQNYNGWISSGTYYRTLQSKSGCDSVVTTLLTVYPVYNINENKSICQGQSYNGWTTSGTYQRTLKTVTGCDSVVVTSLTVHAPTIPSIIQSGDTLRSVNIYKSYQWYNEAGMISGAAGSSYVIPKSGKYYLVVTDSNGCTNSSATVTAVKTAVSITGLAGLQYSVIPNPNRGEFIFRVDSGDGTALTLHLLNPLGQVIETRSIKQAFRNHAEPFDVSRLVKGMYYLVVSDEKEVMTEKIIIQ